MPIYEYQCKSCDSTFEKLVFGSDSKDINCPCCCSPKIKKVMSATRFMGGSSDKNTCAPNTSGFS